MDKEVALTLFWALLQGYWHKDITYDLETLKGTTGFTLRRARQYYDALREFASLETKYGREIPPLTYFDSKGIFFDVEVIKGRVFPIPERR